MKVKYELAQEGSPVPLERIQDLLTSKFTWKQTKIY